MALKRSKRPTHNTNREYSKNFWRKVPLNCKNNSRSNISTTKTIVAQTWQIVIVGTFRRDCINFLLALREEGGVVNTVVVNGTVKALISKSDD